jgi:hypothetical protein
MAAHAATAPAELEAFIKKWESVEPRPPVVEKKESAPVVENYEKKERPPGYGILEPPKIRHTFLHDIYPAPADALYGL